MHRIVLMALPLACGGVVLAQSASPAAFVCNNGNSEGSVTSFAFNEDRSPRFVQRVVTGNSADGGSNAYEIGLSPDGVFLATTHATGSDDLEQLTILRVNADATMVIERKFATPDSPLDCDWIGARLLAVTLTNLSVPNKVIAYRFDEETLTLTEIDREDTGDFNAYLAFDPVRGLLFADDSTGRTLRSFRVEADGTLTLLDAESTGNYCLGPGVTPDGTKVYGGGGISGDGHAVVGLHVAADGTLVPMNGSPFHSPGASPKSCVASSDGRYLVAAHGTDATARVFSIDGETGTLASTGFSYDIGVQGSLGECAVLGDLLLITDRDTISDGVRGLRCFTINGDGSLTQNGDIVDTQGIGPNGIAVRQPPPPCVADFNGDGLTNVFDFLDYQTAFSNEDPRADLAAPFGVLNVFDFLAFQTAFGEGC